MGNDGLPVSLAVLLAGVILGALTFIGIIIMAALNLVATISTATPAG
jgi:hypothetical protein